MINKFEETIQYTKNDVVSFMCCKCKEETSVRVGTLRRRKELMCVSCFKKKNSLIKYGVEFPSQSKEVREKRKKTFIEKYGVENPFQIEEVKEKIKNTNKEKYGDENPYCFGSKLFKNLIFEKYKVENISQLEETQIKIKETSQTKYGCEHFTQNKDVISKTMSTCKNKYGDNYYYEFNNRIKNILLTNRGIENISYDKETVSRRKITRKTNFYKQMVEGDRLMDKVTPLFLEKEYVAKKNNYELFRWKCNECGNEFLAFIANGLVPRCVRCYPLFGACISQMEKELGDYVESLGFKIERSNRKLIAPQEIDIYIPEKKLAIEFDGLYWHSNIYKDSNYHRDKTEAAEAVGIRMIHVFEDEWVNKKNIVKNRLNHILGAEKGKSIFGRKCEIKEISASDKNKFLIERHIQGVDNSSIKLGAFYENELIAVMTFSKPRAFMNKKVVEGVWELGRFATEFGCYTPGVASKLMAYFKRNYKWNMIYTYADRRWSQGNLYRQLGFEQVDICGVNYYYVDPENGERRHRYNFRKSNLVKFKSYSDDKTEFQITDEEGYYRIFDCGNYKFEMKNEEKN